MRPFIIEKEGKKFIVLLQEVGTQHRLGGLYVADLLSKKISWVKDEDFEGYTFVCVYGDE